MNSLILSYVLGPLENNTYLVADLDTKAAALIDPSYDIELLLDDAVCRSLRIQQILLTHAHFDHIAGVARAATSQVPSVPVALHPLDLVLYRQGGGAYSFGLPWEPAPDPDILLENAQRIQIGSIELEVYHTPGHTPGHVIFLCREAQAVFCGDLIFAGGVGRTDLPGGNSTQLIASIRRSILVLPVETRLFSGHGPETTVGVEKVSNPFIF